MGYSSYGLKELDMTKAAKPSDYHKLFSHILERGKSIKQVLVTVSLLPQSRRWEGFCFFYFTLFVVEWFR